jgi:vacuolar-type H+-ATPase subunit I/STV1
VGQFGTQKVGQFAPRKVGQYEARLVGQHHRFFQSVGDLEDYLDSNPNGKSESKSTDQKAKKNKSPDKGSSETSETLDQFFQNMFKRMDERFSRMEKELDSMKKIIDDIKFNGDDKNNWN